MNVKKIKSEKKRKTLAVKIISINFKRNCKHATGIFWCQKWDTARRIFEEILRRKFEEILRRNMKKFYEENKK